MPKETIGRTIGVAAAVCVVCSIFVSSTAVMLKPRIDMNRTLDRNRNILIAVGAIKEDESVDKVTLKEKFDTHVREQWVNLDEGVFVADQDVPEKCRDEKKAEKSSDRERSKEIGEAGLKRRAVYRRVYVTPKEGPIKRIVLPVHGKGLWSTMYGFLALDSDLSTIKRFAFYEHGETPGLGGEVDNDDWKELWVDKNAYGETFGIPVIDIVKGTADRDSPHEIDGLSGATLTANGVEKLVLFWLGEDGYGKLLKTLREGRPE